MAACSVFAMSAIVVFFQNDQSRDITSLSDKLKRSTEREIALKIQEEDLRLRIAKLEEELRPQGTDPYGNLPDWVLDELVPFLALGAMGATCLLLLFRL